MYHFYLDLRFYKSFQNQHHKTFSNKVSLSSSIPTSNVLFLAGYTSLRQRKYVNEICEAGLLTSRKQSKLN